MSETYMKDNVNIYELIISFPMCTKAGAELFAKNIFNHLSLDDRVFSRFDHSLFLMKAQCRTNTKILEYCN